MPVIHIDILHQTKEKKKEIVEKVTATMAEITKIPVQAFVVLISEYDADSCGTGGVCLSDRK